MFIFAGWIRCTTYAFFNRKRRKKATKSFGFCQINIAHALFHVQIKIIYIHTRIYLLNAVPEWVEISQRHHRKSTEANKNKSAKKPKEKNWKYCIKLLVGSYRSLLDFVGGFHFRSLILFLFTHEKNVVYIFICPITISFHLLMCRQLKRFFSVILWFSPEWNNITCDSVN